MVSSTSADGLQVNDYSIWVYYFFTNASPNSDSSFTLVGFTISRKPFTIPLRLGFQISADSVLTDRLQPVQLP
jgi:hypothetical protein